MAIDTLGANALASNSVTTAKIANDAVTGAKIPADAVVAADIADGSITTAKLADNSVTSAKSLNLGRRNIIINGDMSIIGPRPQTRRCFEAFPESAKDAIISVRPGLSGIGSIFFRNEELMLNDADNADEYYDKVIMPYKGQLEQWYVKHYSIKIYFLLIMELTPTTIPTESEGLRYLLALIIVI